MDMRWGWRAGAVVCAALTAGGWVLEAGSSDREGERFRESVRQELRLSDEETRALVGPLDAYLNRTRDRERVREVLRAAAGQGCRGACLAETVRCMNRALARGRSPLEAEAMVGAALGGRARPDSPDTPGDGGLRDAERLRRRFEAGLGVPDVPEGERSPSRETPSRGHRAGPRRGPR